MMYETKFKLNRAPIDRLYSDLDAYRKSINPIDGELSAEQETILNQKWDAIDRMRNRIELGALELFLYHGMPEGTADFDRHIMPNYFAPQQDHMWVKFDLTEKNVEAYRALLDHLAPFLTTTQRFKMFREVAHRLLFLELGIKRRGHGKCYPVIGYVAPYNQADTEKSDFNGLVDSQHIFSEVGSADFKRWKAEGMDRFEFTVSVRDTPYFMDEYDDVLECDHRQYYNMAI